MKLNAILLLVALLFAAHAQAARYLWCDKSTQCRNDGFFPGARKQLTKYCGWANLPGTAMRWENRFGTWVLKGVGPQPDPTKVYNFKMCCYNSGRAHCDVRRTYLPPLEPGKP